VGPYDGPGYLAGFDNHVGFWEFLDSEERLLFYAKLDLLTESSFSYPSPFFNFGKIIIDITGYAAGRRDPVTEITIPGVGFTWANLYEEIPSRYVPDDAVS
jgi:hypothetical protein